MKRKILTITISYIIGLIWGLYFSKNIALIFCLFCLIYFGFKKNVYIILIIVTIITSCMYSNFVKSKYDVKYNNIEECQITGTIVKELKSDNTSKKYIVRINDVNGNFNYKNTRVIIVEKCNKKFESTTSYGNLVSIYGNFKIADTSRNYKGFDYNQYLRSQKIYGTITTTSDKVKIYKLSNVSKYNKLLHSLYDLAEKNIYKILPKQTADLCVAIILGDKSNLDESTINQFSESNLAHIIVVSGMHMNYIVLIIYQVLKNCGKRKRKYCIIITSILFCNFVGNTNSIVRASVMIIVATIGSLLHKKSDIITNVSLAALIILISNPYAIKDIGFILSFTATISLILFSKPIKNKFENTLDSNKIFVYIKESILSSIVANILIIPVIAVYMNKISFTFIISGLISTILLSIIMPLSIICIVISFISINLASFFATFLNFFLSILLYSSNLISKIKILSFIIVTPSIISIVTYYLLIFIMLWKNNTNKKRFVNKVIKLLVAIYTITAIIISSIKFFDKNLYIYFIDVGQGDSTLIVTPGNKNILIDGGGSEESNYIGKRVLVPYLLNRGIKTLDYVMISHFDTDHVRTEF